jgi:hypothetical protein
MQREAETLREVEIGRKDIEDEVAAMRLTYLRGLCHEMEKSGITLLDLEEFINAGDGMDRPGGPSVESENAPSADGEVEMVQLRGRRIG